MNRQWDDVERFANSLLKIWQKQSRIFICGNGGSAANAIHLANDYLYGIGSGVVPGMNVEAYKDCTEIRHLFVVGCARLRTLELPTLETVGQLHVRAPSPALG